MSQPGAFTGYREEWDESPTPPPALAERIPDIHPVNKCSCNHYRCHHRPDCYILGCRCKGWESPRV